jgi:hypothetical protein
MRNQAAGATRLPTCPSDLSLAAIRSADSRSATGPTRTRYRTEVPDPPVSTNAENPCPFTWRVKLSAFERLAKLPSCTDQEPCPTDVGLGAADSTLAARAGAALGGCFAGPGAVGVSAAGELAAAVGLGVVVDPVVDPAFDPALDPPVDPSADPAAAPALDAADDADDAPLACGDAGSTSESVGALLVVKSTVTFRIGSGAAAGRVGAGPAFGFGPDNNSGTTNTTSATRIDAPISRSLTRRSITVKYIRDAPLPAAILWTRANRSPVPRYERIRKPRFDRAAQLLLQPRRRRSRRRPRR